MNSVENGNIEQNNDSDSEIEYKLGKKLTPTVEPSKKLTKKGVERKLYELTDKRKIQFENARIKRAENIEKRKLEKQEKDKEFLETKKKLEIKKDGREKIQQEKTLKNISYEIVKKQLQQEESDDDEPQIIIKKKKPKKKVIVIEDSESEDEPIVVHRNKQDKPKQNLPPRQISPLLYF